MGRGEARQGEVRWSAKVFLYKNGIAQPAEIVKGLRTASQVQVLKGVQPGDTVIVSGTMQLRTGQKVILDSVD